MTEYLDVYDENQNYIGKEPRDYVHQNALWHKTVHCWLYDKMGNVYFQIRHDSGTFYTTASGHVLAGESLKEAFGREIKEEIGIALDYERAELIDIVPFRMDKIKKDGSIFRDRAFAHVFIYEIDLTNLSFSFDPNEVDGISKMNARQVFRLLKGEQDVICATIMKEDHQQILSKKRNVSIPNFLINEGETGIGKYGKVLEEVIRRTSNI